MHKKYFGTDGIRGRVGQFPITPLFFLRLGLAAGTVFSRSGKNQVIIGKDTRISGYMLESALEAGFSASGMDVLLLGPMPTPAIAYLTQTFNASAGIVISASHNPYYDNGIKFFSRHGIKLDDHVEHLIEKRLEQEIKTVTSAQLGKVRRIDDAPGRYIEHCKATVQPYFSLSGLNIVLDTANGATYHVGPEIFRELGATVSVINNQPDGLNINERCGSTAPESLRQAVLQQKAHLGIAFDGDGDRVLMIDAQGDLVDGDEILFIIATFLAKKNILKGGVVGTIMSNLGMAHALAAEGIPFMRAQIGDRYVNASLIEKGWLLGGESSGHIICRYVSTTGDGIVAALQVLAAMQGSDSTLSELKKRMQKYPQKIVNIPTTAPQYILNNPIVQQTVSSIEKALGASGRVLLRPSGTEAVLRVMVEGMDAHSVEQHIAHLAEMIEHMAQKQPKVHTSTKSTVQS